MLLTARAAVEGNECGSLFQGFGRSNVVAMHRSLEWLSLWIVPNKTGHFHGSQEKKFCRCLQIAVFPSITDCAASVSRFTE